MDGEPKDSDNECNARLFIGDNYGDGTATMRCQLKPGHEGAHQETFEREGGPVTVTWIVDERVKCDHGCGHWEHEHHTEHVADQCPKYRDDHVWSTCALCNPGKEPRTCAACGKTHYSGETHYVDCAVGKGTSA